MSDKNSWKCRVAGDNEIEQSSRNENNSGNYSLQSYVTDHPNSFPTFHSLETITSELNDFQEVFGDLMDIQPFVASSLSLVQVNTSFASKLGPDNIGQSSGTIKEPHESATTSSELKTNRNNRPKRKRSAQEQHNLAERRRRDWINKKIKTLQEIIPNCYKSDTESVLDDAINYARTLKRQVEMMSIAGKAMLQSLFMPRRGIQSTQVPNFSPYIPIRPDLGMGIGFEMFFSAGHPAIPVPSATLHPSLAAGTGLPLLTASRNITVPHTQMPFNHLQQLPASVDISAMLPDFVLGISPAVSFPSQVGSGSQTMPRTSTDHQQVPIMRQSDRASVLDDAVNYVKALWHQVEMMSAQGGAIFQAPFMSPSGYQSTEVPQISPKVPISPKLGMGSGIGTGMVDMCCSAGHPVISSAPSASLHPSLAAGVGLPLMPASRNLAVSQMQMPCVRSQQLRPFVDTSAMPPKFVLGRYSPAFNFSNEVESSSKTMPGTSNDHHQQDYRPSGHGSSSTTLM